MIAGNVPFNFADSYFTRQHYESLPGSFIPPPRTTIMRRILPELEHEAMIKRKELLSAAKAITIVIDGATNVKRCGIINIMLLTPAPVMLCSKEVPAITHDANYYAKEIITAIDDLVQGETADIESVCPVLMDYKDTFVSKLVAVITDNASVMNAAKRVLRETFPKIIPIGCSAHLFNLIAKDLCSIKRFRVCIESCANVFIEIKASQCKHATWNDYWKRFVEKQKKQGNDVRARGLSLPTETRWFSVCEMLERFTSSKPIIERMMKKGDINSPRNIEFLSEQSTWPSIEKVIIYSA